MSYIVNTMDENTPPQPVITASEDTSGTNNASVLLNMENMIKSYISSIDRQKEELSKYQGMLDDILENDATYKAHTEQAKEAARIKSATKQQILKQPQAAELADKVKNLRVEIKENQATLSDYAGEYQRMSGINEIEGEDGEMREIVLVPKIVKRSAKFPR
ncbi:MAG: hypothetical protein C4584_01720 [Armatimonadetes bacterium]|nr:MAG: hypothetical protein C4584_01720 [Armatimonadota bacterium]